MTFLNSMNDIHYIIPLIFVLVIVFLIILFHFQKKAIIKKITSLTPEEKKRLLWINWGHLRAIATTWLIELWKGQYGINTGCELGIYYADEIISPDKYSSTLFHSAKTEDMLEVSLHLNKLDSKNHSRYIRLGDMQKKHWWLTIFKMGIIMSYIKRLSKAFKNAPILPIDYHSKYAFFSDCHRGTGNNNDNFLKNDNCYLAALQYYYQTDFKYGIFGLALSFLESQTLPVLQ